VRSDLALIPTTTTTTTSTTSRPPDAHDNGQDKGRGKKSGHDD
jgi:hypothetical protein